MSTEHEHITCPCCQTEYSELDAPLEFARVQNFEVSEAYREQALLHELEKAQATLREVCEWLRAHAPGKALEAAERKI